MSWKRTVCAVALSVAVLMPGCGGTKEVEYKSDVDKMTPEHKALVEQMKNQDNQNTLPSAAPQQSGGMIQPPSNN